MPVDLRIRGADEIDRIARMLKQAGDEGLRRDFYRGINRAVKPLKAKVKQSALATLPRRGGLNKRVAASKVATRTRSGRDPGVRLTSTTFAGVDRGVVRHPVFGNRAAWVTQPVRPGWFTKPLEGGAPEVRKELLEVLDDVARRLARVR